MTPRRYYKEEKALLVAYRQAETRLLELIKNHAVKLNRGTERYYRRQHAALRAAMREAEAVLEALKRRNLTAIDEIAAEAYTAGLRDAGVRFEFTPFSTGVNSGAVRALTTDTVKTLNRQLVQIHRNFEDVYRKITTIAVRDAIVTGAPHTTALRHALDQAADHDLVFFVDRANRKWRMDSYLDMAVRTVKHRAIMEGKFQGFRELGVDLVRISSHPASSPQCAPYQGKILALDGNAGTRIVFDSDGNAKTIHVAATMWEAIRNGYKHPNCRHVETAYISGDVPDPPEYDESEYKALQKQRHYENKIREWKRKEKMALTPGQLEYRRAKVREWQAINREHVAQYDFLTRAYWREQI